MHEKLLDVEIGYTTLWNFVKVEKLRAKEVFIRQRFSAARESRIRLGEVKLLIELENEVSASLFTEFTKRV
jgi:hypothetical protein